MRDAACGDSIGCGGICVTERSSAENPIHRTRTDSTGWRRRSSPAPSSSRVSSRAGGLGGAPGFRQDALQPGEGILEHLENHDVTYVVVARAPIALSGEAGMADTTGPGAPRMADDLDDLDDSRAPTPTPPAFAPLPPTQAASLPGRAQDLHL